MVYEIWDLESRNAVGDFDTEAEALAEVAAMVREYGAETMLPWALERVDGEDVTPVAEGEELIRMALAIVQRAAEPQEQRHVEPAQEQVTGVAHLQQGPAKLQASGTSQVSEYNHTVDILDNDGQLIGSAYARLVQQVGRNGLREWAGTIEQRFLDSSIARLFRSARGGTKLTLRLDNGRSGTVIVSETPVDPENPLRIQGTGQAPFD